MPITLVTGTPGAGKTLYTLAKLVPHAIADLHGDDGQVVKRRLCVGGVRDLLLDHVPIDVPRIRDWDDYLKHSSVSVDRRPGDPPLDVQMRADNWHQWCQPGDVIVIDEAQHVFKPMAAGRAVPAFISNLEEHRHYGVDFIVITQHPNLLHVNVRALVNPHLHVRRLFGRSASGIYEWDRCSPVTAYKQATNSKVWRHDKKAYSVYKSSELHTKFSRALPLPLIMAALAILALPVVWWYALHRTVNTDPVTATAVSAATHVQQLDGDAKTPAPRSSPFVPPGPPAFDGVVVAQASWPLIIAGCWAEQGGGCSCITREERPRIVTDRPALCMAIAMGDLQPPPGLPRPERAPELVTAASSPTS